MQNATFTLITTQRLRYGRDDNRENIPRGGGEVPREAHNLQTPVRFRAPQQRQKHPDEGCFCCDSHYIEYSQLLKNITVACNRVTRQALG